VLGIRATRARDRPGVKHLAPISSSSPDNARPVEPLYCARPSAAFGRISPRRRRGARVAERGDRPARCGSPTPTRAAGREVQRAWTPHGGNHTRHPRSTGRGGRLEALTEGVLVALRTAVRSRCSARRRRAADHSLASISLVRDATWLWRFRAPSGPHRDDSGRGALVQLDGDQLRRLEETRQSSSRPSRTSSARPSPRLRAAPAARQHRRTLTDRQRRLSDIIGRARSPVGAREPDPRDVAAAGRAREVQRKPLDLAELVDRAFEELHPRATEAG